MKNLILIISVITACAFFAGCSKKDESCNPSFDAAPVSEVLALEQYLSTNKIEATKNDLGFYYKIEAAGTGEHPDACSEVDVNYKGSLTNGNIFEQKQNLHFQLKGLIKGWQVGIPLIGKGGKITLYLPPSLAYGDRESNGIPANSILIFTIDLIKVY